MSNNLWVGSLSSDVTESDLRSLLEKYGAVDSVSCYPSRNYAFVYLKNAEDALKVRENLQGFVLRGSPLKIEFAKSAKPCNSLWVSGLGSSISKEVLLEEFSKFGKIQDFKFQWEKRSAYIDYFRVEDASKALKAMHGKYKGGSVIRVDYSRSHSRRNILPSEGQKEGEQSSNILCISYPPAVHIDEQMLHNAMILFGEIEKIRSVPSKYCSFVEFRSMEEAQLAKDGLQGKLFNDPRILITFSINESAPNQYLFGTTGPMPDASFNRPPFQAVQLESIGQPVVPNSFHGGVIPHGIGGLDSSVQSFSPLGSFNSVIPGQELGFGVSYPNHINPIGGRNQRSSPPNQMLSLPLASMKRSTKPTPIQREPKRLRTDSTVPLNEMNDRVFLNDHISRGLPQVKGLVPTNTRFTSGNANIDRPSVNYIWRGVIAKAGNHVCRARCVPVGDWIGYEIPEIVNCSARTGLDMLAKHYTDAIGFDIVYFLPDSEDDFASYTEFLQFMGDRNRAGVVKFDDGTTLFLVPPSDFLRTVLKVSGPERLYGVVLKFPQNASDSISGSSISQPHYVGRLHDSLTSNPKPVYSVPPVTATPAISHGLSLTPELVATLASLTKVNSNGHQLSGSTVAGPQSQGHIYEHETSNMSGQFIQKQGYLSSTVDISDSAVTKSSHNQNSSFNQPHHQSVVSMTSSSYQTPQGVHSNASQQYQLDYPQDLHIETPSAFHPGAYGVASSKQVYGTNVNEPQSIVNSGTHLPEQMQEIQSSLKEASQETPEFDAYKNERYQSTLQFAANLLLQIQKRSGTETDGNR